MTRNRKPKPEHLAPTNDIFDGNIDEATPSPQFFVCRKCNEKIWTHVYNEHIKFCGKFERNPHQPQPEITKNPVVEEEKIIIDGRAFRPLKRRKWR